jgi:hypothetical protein
LQSAKARIDSVVHAALAKPLDWLAIQVGCWSVKRKGEWIDPDDRAARLLSQPEFFAGVIGAPNDLRFEDSSHFRFTSPIASAYPGNNTALGQFFHCPGNWVEHPAVILVHGWNASVCYRNLFPRLANRLVQRGVNVVTLELPYHGRRQPWHDGVAVNFISQDLVQMLQATQQAVAEIRALIAWLRAQGCQRVGVWGFSLGAWLAGLVTCLDAANQFSVLLTPVARLERIIRELAFCAPIRKSLEKTKLDLAPLDLAAHRPTVSPDRILIVASQHDLFASLETVEEVWRAWNRPEFWLVPHGHISVLISPRTLDRIIAWIARRALNLETTKD